MEKIFLHADKIVYQFGPSGDKCAVVFKKIDVLGRKNKTSEENKNTDVGSEFTCVKRCNELCNELLRAFKS